MRFANRMLFDEHGGRRCLENKSERVVLINGDDNRDDQASVFGSFFVEFFGESRDIDAVRAERRTDGRSRSRFACGQLQFYDCCNFLSHISS